MVALKANHLATAKAVAKKAQTIMKQADADGSGTLTLDEFLVVAKKFPNLVSGRSITYLQSLTSTICRLNRMPYIM